MMRIAAFLTALLLSATVYGGTIESILDEQSSGTTLSSKSLMFNNSGRNLTVSCDKGWTLVLTAEMKQACAWVLKEPKQ